MPTEWEDGNAVLRCVPDLAFPICSDADLCISFLMSLLLLCEFRLEEDLERKIALAGWTKISVRGPSRVEEQRMVSRSVLGKL